MRKRKKVTGALVCAGLALSLVACSAGSSNGESGSVEENVLSVQQQSDGRTYAENYENSNGRTSFIKDRDAQQLSEEQIAALQAYKELSNDIYQKYNEQYETLVLKFKADTEEIYTFVIGDAYTELKNEYNELSSQFNCLINGFYGSEEYIALKSELDTLITSLVAYDKNSEEYRIILDEIHTVWGEISVLAGEINSQLMSITLRAAEITSQVRKLINQNEEAINELLAPIVKQFNTDVCSLHSSLMNEIEILRQTLGI